MRAESCEDELVFRFQAFPPAAVAFLCAGVGTLYLELVRSFGGPSFLPGGAAMCLVTGTLQILRRPLVKLRTTEMVLQTFARWGPQYVLPWKQVTGWKTNRRTSYLTVNASGRRYEIPLDRLRQKDRDFLIDELTLRVGYPCVDLERAPLAARARWEEAGVLALTFGGCLIVAAGLFAFLR